jgi:hypothetical protein
VKGAVRDFRYYAGDEQPFAFIVNVDSLLFYFRKPAMPRFLPMAARLNELFPDLQRPREHEMTVRIRDVDQAQALMHEVFGYVDG